MRILLLALLSGCAHLPPAPLGMITGPNLPARLYCVERDSTDACAIYRSAQPTAAEFAQLQERFGIRSVVKLNDLLPFDGGDDEVPHGILVLRDKWLPVGPVTHEQVQEALEDLEAAPKPTIVHCTRGENRTGLLVALHRVRHGSAPFAAHAEWVAYGQDDAAFPLLLDVFERETGWTAYRSSWRRRSLIDGPTAIVDASPKSTDIDTTLARQFLNRHLAAVKGDELTRTHLPAKALWLRQGALDAPSEYAEAARDHMIGKPSALGPVREKQRLASEGERVTGSSISSLLCSGSPTAITGIIVPVVVDSVDGGRYRRAWTHIGEEVLERVPARTDRDSASAIDRIFGVSGIMAPVSYPHPSYVLNCSHAPRTMPVGGHPRAGDLGFVASTGLTVAPHQFRQLDDLFITTLAFRYPKTATLADDRIQQRPPIEDLPSASLSPASSHMTSMPVRSRARNGYCDSGFHILEAER